jgi:hypothetical protein
MFLPRPWEMGWGVPCQDGSVEALACSLASGVLPVISYLPPWAAGNWKRTCSISGGEGRRARAGITSSAARAASGSWGCCWTAGPCVGAAATACAPSAACSWGPPAPGSALCASRTGEHDPGSDFCTDPVLGWSKTTCNQSFRGSTRQVWPRSLTWGGERWWRVETSCGKRQNSFSAHLPCTLGLNRGRAGGTVVKQSRSQMCPSSQTWWSQVSWAHDLRLGQLGPCYNKSHCCLVGGGSAAPLFFWEDGGQFPL